MEKELLELYSWVVRGKQRRAVLKALDGLKTPTQVKEKTKLGLNNVSDILRSFAEKGVAVCVNEGEKVGRLYRLTKKGRYINEKLS